MEAEIQRRDRDALFADRRAAAARVERETDEILAAAAELRRTHMVRFVDEMRAGPIPGASAIGSPRASHRENAGAPRDLRVISLSTSRAVREKATQSADIRSSTLYGG